MMSSERLALRLSSLTYLFAFAATLWEAPLLLNASVAGPTLLRCGIGFVASLVGVVSPNVVCALVQLVLYRRVQKDGGSWFGYAWETQLDETGLLCFVLALAPDGPSYIARVARFCARVALHVLAFRIMLAAGLLKMRAHECWRDHTCLHYHFTTTPQPTPLAFYVAQLPLAVKSWMQWASIDMVELTLPFGFLLELPRAVLASIPLLGFRFISWIPLIGLWMTAVLTLVFMLGIQATGNYSFLQLLTAVPCVAALGIGGGRDSIASKPATGSFVSYVWSIRLFVIPRSILAVFLTVLLGVATHPGFAYLTSGARVRNPVPWVVDLFGGGSSFSSGRFAGMTTIRDETSVHVLRCTSREGEPDCAQGDASKSKPSVKEYCTWEEVDIACKVGSVSRTPCFTSPFHRRFAWQWWFIGLGGDTSFMQQWLTSLKRGQPEAWFALEVGDNEMWEVKAVTVRMHRYTWNVDRPVASDTVMVDGYPLVDQADGRWWSRGRGRSLATVRMSTTWERHLWIPHRWWSALRGLMSRSEYRSDKPVIAEVWNDLKKESAAWWQKLRYTMTREFSMFSRDHAVASFTGAKQHARGLVAKARSICTHIAGSTGRTEL